jgi:uncharacterized membrane-anchored protein YitT (DUF2179 family)
VSNDLSAYGAFSGKEEKVIETVVNRRQIISNRVREIDCAFITIENSRITAKGHGTIETMILNFQQKKT